MKIELRGIVQNYHLGHTHVDLVVTEDSPDHYVTHQMGVDIKVNRGKVLMFLAGIYGIRPGEIVWPDHIRLTEEEDSMSLPL